jgi:O-antigen/teichoic acid export membrane protein
VIARRPPADRRGPADEVFPRLARNVAYLMSSQAAGGVLGLLTLAVTARALGPAGLGALAMIETYLRAVDGLVRPETWQAVIRYGAAALEAKRGDAFGRLLRLGLAVDVAGAALAAALAAGGALLLGPSLGLDPVWTFLTAVAALMLLASATSAATAVLRLFDRFGTLSRIAVAVAAARLAFAAAAAAFDGGVAGFVAAMMAAHVLEGGATLGAAARELRRRGRLGALRAPLTGVVAENPGFWRFVVNANVAVQARQSTQRFDTLLVGVLLRDASAVGAYQLAKRLGLAAFKLARPLQQAIFPDAARLASRGERARLRRIVLRVGGGAGALALAGAAGMTPFAREITTALFGAEFAGAAAPLSVQAFAVALLFVGAGGLIPALYALGRDRALARLSLGCAAAFFVCLVALAPPLGVVGASLAHLAFAALWVGGAAALFLRATAEAAPDAPV